MKAICNELSALPASDLGLAPLPLWRDASGLTLTPTLGAGRAIEQADFSDPETLRAILAPVSALHRSGARFRGRVDLHQLLLRYYALLAKPVQARFADRLRRAGFERAFVFFKHEDDGIGPRLAARFGELAARPRTRAEPVRPRDRRAREAG